MDWTTLFLFLATAIVFLVFGAICMAAISAKEKEDIYTDAYKLGYEMGKKAEKEKVFKAIDEFADKLINWKSQSEEYKNLSDVCNEIAEDMKGGAEC